jgi:DNA helicase II / ATP-dependent DNA helicase PcrA
VLTYTQSNQAALRSRLAHAGPLQAQVHVLGWFAFLMAHWVRPYLPRQFPGHRLRGLNFDGDPGMYATGRKRFLDSEQRAYRRHLAQLGVDVSGACAGAVIDRLSRIYDTIHIDEVQDLNGYDLEVLELLLDAPVDLALVGDIRQALISTNPRDPKNKQYKGPEIGKWFQERAGAGRLQITHAGRTWRCNPEIAAFADTIFHAGWGFPATQSLNSARTGHDGVFAVAHADVPRYVERFEPLCLRHSAASAKDVELSFTNIAIAKGMDVERVLIWPTAKMEKFLRNGTLLEGTPCCELYVAVTRARASVAFAVSKPEGCGLPLWHGSAASTTP